MEFGCGNSDVTYRREFFNHDGPVAIFVKEFIGTTRMLFPSIKGLELIDVYGSCGKFLKIHPSILKSTKL